MDVAPGQAPGALIARYVIQVAFRIGLEDQRPRLLVLALTWCHPGQCPSPYAG